MQTKNQEIIAIIIIGALLALLLVGFIIAMLVMYQKRQQAHKEEMAKLQDEYDQQILRVQFEMQEATLAEISNKLHDTLKNNINGIAMSISALAIKLEKGLINTTEAVAALKVQEADAQMVRDEIRLTSHSLSQDKLNNIGLIDAIVFELNRIKRNIDSLTVINNIDTTKNYYFTQEQSVYLYRIFQEIMGNVLSHAKATQVITIANLDANNTFLLSIADNGIGFNIAEKKKNKLSGIGLLGMQKRAAQIGATLIITSNHNIGTTIEIELPLPHQNLNNGKQQVTSQYSFD